MLSIVSNLRRVGRRRSNRRCLNTRARRSRRNRIRCRSQRRRACKPLIRERRFGNSTRPRARRHRVSHPNNAITRNRRINRNCCSLRRQTIGQRIREPGSVTRVHRTHLRHQILTRIRSNNRVRRRRPRRRLAITRKRRRCRNLRRNTPIPLIRVRNSCPAGPRTIRRRNRRTNSRLAINRRRTRIHHRHRRSHRISRCRREVLVNPRLVVVYLGINPGPAAAASNPKARDALKHPRLC